MNDEARKWSVESIKRNPASDGQAAIAGEQQQNPRKKKLGLGCLTNIIGLRLLGDMLLANGQARSSLK